MRPSSMKKRQRYLDVATELFLEQGYEATGLDQLIERCGGSKLTLYSYFGDKRGLLKAVVHEVTEQLGEVLKFEATEEEELKNQLVMFAYNYMKFIYAPKMLKLSRLVLANNQQEPELVSYFLERGAHHSQSTVLTFLEQQDRLGRLQIDDVFLACEQLLGALKGNRHIEALYTDRVMNEQEMTRYAEHAINAFLRSYQ